MGWRKRMRSDMDDAWARLGELEDLIDAWDRAADAAMLEPGCPQLPSEPQIPAQRQPTPKDIMGGQQ